MFIPFLIVTYRLFTSTILAFTLGYEANSRDDLIFTLSEKVGHNAMSMMTPSPTFWFELFPFCECNYPRNTHFLMLENETTHAHVTISSQIPSHLGDWAKCCSYSLQVSQ